MAKYSGKPVVIQRAAAEIASKFDDLSLLQPALDNMSAADRAKVGDVTFEKDAIHIQTPQVGEIQFRVNERLPERISMEAVGAPVPLKMYVDLKPVDDASTELTTSIDVEIPAMLRPLIGGTMQKAADQFGALMSRLA